MRTTPLTLRLRHLPGISGFSLVELLICIAIIAVLIALGVSGTQSLRHENKAIRCTQQLRNLSVLVHNYASDNNGSLAWYVRGQGVKGFWWHSLWQHCGLPASEMSKLLTCPSHSDPRKYKIGVQEVQFSYRYNKRLGYYNDTAAVPGWAYPLRKFHAAGSPSKVPLLADSYVMPDNASGFESWPDMWAAHGDGHFGNVVMMDGHMERIRKAPSASAVPGSYNWDALPNF